MAQQLSGARVSRASILSVMGLLIACTGGCRSETPAGDAAASARSEAELVELPPLGGKARCRLTAATFDPDTGDVHAVLNCGALDAEIMHTRFSDGRIVQTASLPHFNRPEFVELEHISLDGTVLVGHAAGGCLWVEGESSAFYPVPRSAVAEVRDISGDGSVVVGQMFDPNGANPWPRAMVWRRDGGFDLFPTMRRICSAEVVSDDGTVVWGVIGTPEEDRIFRWENGRHEVILAISKATGDLLRLWGVSEDGRVLVATIARSGGNREVAKIVDGSIVWISDLGLPGATTDRAFVSRDGRAVVGEARWKDRPIGTTFVWIGDRVTLLEDLLAENGIGLKGLQLSEPVALSPDGSSIVGIGESEDGPRNWIARLPG